MREVRLRGEFRPGERIREIQLSDRLHVSRTPLRLVLGRREDEGQVVARDLRQLSGFRSPSSVGTSSDTVG